MKLLNTLFLILFTQMIFGQSNDSFEKNAIYYDLLGHTRSILSVNYERTIFSLNDYFHVNVRTGIGYEGGKVEGVNGEKNRRVNTRTTFPNVLMLQIGKKYHFVNLGVGYSMTFASNLKDDSVIPATYSPRFDSAYSFSVGYRLMYEKLIIQVYPVLINSKKSNDSEISLGISFGYVW